jgi:hypothetical protein
MKNMYIVILCVILILLIVSNNTLEEGLTSTKKTENAGKFIGGIRKIPLYNSLPRGLRTMIEKFTSFIIFI